MDPWKQLEMKKGFPPFRMRKQNPIKRLIDNCKSKVAHFGPIETTCVQTHAAADLQPQPY